MRKKDKTKLMWGNKMIREKMVQGIKRAMTMEKREERRKSNIITWSNKDLRKLHSQKLREVMKINDSRTKISKALIGKKFSEERKENIKKAMNDPIIKEKQREALILKWKSLSKAEKLHLSKIWTQQLFLEKSRMAFFKMRKKQVLPFKDTSIEIKIQNFLKELGITFFTHQYMNITHGYQCDILIPSLNTVIECDGDYYHNYPIGNNLDHIRVNELVEKGFKVLRLWEGKIRVMALNEFKEKLYERLTK